MQRVLSVQANCAVERALVGAILVGVSLSCGEEVPTNLTPTPVDLFTVTVTPSSITLVSVGETVQLTAIAPLCSGVTFTWSSSDSSIATVNTSGLVTAVANGTATITASVTCVSFPAVVGGPTGGDVSGTATVTVAQAANTVTVDPATATLSSIGETTQLTATASDANGNAISGQTFTWSSSDSSVVTVSSAGSVTAVANGTTTITATTDGVSGTATVTVAQAVNTVLKPAPPTDAD
jgi:uncharacterized protein YjdB